MTDNPAPAEITPPAKPEKPKKKRRTWRQRFKILVLILLIAAFLFRIALNILLPTVINKVAGIFDLEVGYDRLKLSLLGGTANIYGLKLRPKGGGESILQSDYIQGDISPLNLLRGRLIVHRAEVDGVILAINREADGSIPLLKHFLSAAKAQPAATVASAPSAKPMSLDAPLRVDAVRVSHVSVRLRDRSVTPAFEAVVQTTLRVNHVGDPGDPTHIELDVGIDPLLDTLRVSGEAHTSPDELNADVKVLVRGLHPKEASAYLAMLGIKPVASDVTVQADAKLSAKTIPNTADFSASLAVSNVTAVTDGAQWASLKSLDLEANRLGASGVDIKTLSVQDGQATARRTAEGKLELAGFELGTSAAAKPTATQPAAAPAAPSAVIVSSAPPFHFSLGELNLQKLVATVTDEAVSPSANLVARLDSMTVKGVDTNSQQAVPVSIIASLPGVIRSASVVGTVTPFASSKTAAFHVAAEGIRPDELKPYLERIGLQSQLQNGKFVADINGSFAASDKGVLTVSAGVTGIKLTDGDTSLAELAWAKIDSLSFTPADGSIAVKSIDGSGPSITVARTADNHISSAGLTFVGMPVMPQQTKIASTQPTTTGAISETPSAKLPKISLGHLGWGGVNLTLEDQSADTKSTFVFNDAGVDLSDLILDLGSTNPERKAGKFVAWLAAPGIADTLKATGSFAPGLNRLTTIIDVAGDGITLAKLSPYLQPFGVVPTLSTGKVVAKMSGTLSQIDAGFGVELEAHDVAYTDGPTELAGVDYLGINGLALSAKRIDFDALNISRPRIRVARDADGTFRAAGIHLVPVTTAPAAPVATPTTAPATTSASPALLALPPLPIELGLKALRVADATIDWADAVPAKPAAVHAVASVAMDNINIAPNAAPATLHVAAHVDDVLNAATVDGTLGLSPQSPAAKLAIKADGLRAGPLGSYLPPNLEATLSDGHFETNVELGVSNHAKGGLAAHVAADLLKFADGQTLLAKVDAFTLAVNRVDPAAGVFALGELSSRGVIAEATQKAEGLEVLGLRMVTPSVASGSTQPAANRATEVALPTIAPNVPVASLSSMVTDARKPLPRITLDKLDLGVERLTAAGFTGADAAPVSVKNLTVTSPGPLSFGGADAENAPPLVVNIAGGVSPVVGKFDVGVTVTPFATEPAVAIDVAASELKGAGITKVLPALAQRLDGSGLTDGTFKTHINASINYGRHGPRDLDVGRGFVATFDVKPLEMRATPGGPVLAGVVGVHGEGIKVEPKTGNVAVKLVEVSTPIARAYRDDKGIHAAGLTLLMGANESAETLTATTQSAASQPSTGPAVAPATTRPLGGSTDRATEVAPPPIAPAQRPANEVRVDRFTVSGIDVVLEDRTSKPPTIVPLKTLDVDVQDLSNQLPWSGKSMRFSVLATSDKVPLPPRKGATGTATTQPVEGGEYTEQRDLFSQVSANGKIGFYRSGDTVTLDGWTKTAVNGFELLGVRGLAQQFGVTIGGGSFDDTNDVRFNRDGVIDTKTKVVFTNLSLSEPANGPLSRLLKLPAPIDVAIGAVTDPDGSITMPLAVPIKNGAVGVGDVIGPALGAVTNVLVTGIASAPMKAVGGLGNLIGLGGDKDAVPEPPVVVKFLPAYAGLDAASNEQISKLGQQLQKDENLELQLRHTMTDADVARAAIRANPSPETAMALAERVRNQKAGLQLRYAALQAQARGDFGAQANARAAQSTDALRTIGKQLAQAEQSLDDLYALTTPGAAAQTDRRTRAAALDIARQRLETLKAAIDKAAGAKIGERVHTTNAQFDPVASADGGDVTIVLVRKKH